MDKVSTQQLKEIKRIWIQGLEEIIRLGDGKTIEIKGIWIQGLEEKREKRTGQSEKKRAKKTGQSKKKAKNQTGQFKKKADLENQTGQSEKKAKNQTGQSYKIARNQTGQSEKKAKDQTRQSDKKAENQTGQSEKKADNQTRQSEKKAKHQTGQSDKVIHDSERREFGSSNNENAVEKHWRQRNYNDYCPCHSFKLLKRILSVFLVFLHCAWVDGLGDGRQEQKAVNGIFQHTLGTVSHCPNVSEYMKRASDKCAVACGSHTQTENCAYHCMRDSSKKRLVEFCAKTVILFEYCPEYELLGQRIQKDIDTLCKPSKSLQSYYNSSDIFFCDPEDCQKLHDAGGSTDLTGLVTENTQSNSRDINDTWSPQYWYMLLLLVLALFAVLVFACIFRMRKNLAAWFGKITKKRNSNGSKQKRESEAFIP